MDENIREEERHEHRHNDDCFLCNHHIMRHLITALLVFLGAFCAFYAVSDWHFKRLYDPSYQIRKMEHAMMNQERNMERAFRKHMKKDFLLEKKAGEISHIEKTPDAYKIIIDLKPFDNDPKNVEVKANGDTLSINAAGIKNGRKGEAIYKFMQNYSFDENVNLSDMQKEKIGDALVITIPTEND